MAGGIADPTLLILDDAPATPPPPSGLVQAIDVSSNQGMDIGPLIDRYRPQHVITKLYQRIELGSVGYRYSIAHAETARARSCTVGGYGWLYAGIGGATQVGEFLRTAQGAGIALGLSNPLWLDCEDYTDGSYPSLDVIRQAVQECGRRGVACGIYTGGWWWIPRTRNAREFRSLPLWASVYDGSPEMVTVGFGGWHRLAGKQWSGSPVDRSTFRAEYATP